MPYNDIESKMRSGDWSGALALSEADLGDRPADARLHGLRGMCLFRLGDFATAEEAFRKATLLDPNFVDGAVKRAQCLDRLHRREEAYEIANEWRRRFPSVRALQGLCETLAPDIRGNRSEGWERSVAMQIRHIETGN